MKKLLGYLLTPIYLFVFASILLIFHPIQVITRLIWGYEVRKKTVDILNYLILKSLIILGVRISYHGFEKLPKNKPLIIVSNHQSTLDIPPIVWAFRKHHPKFISKKELGKNIPSISYNLRHGGSVLIDRKDGRQSVKQILNLGAHIEANNYSASIFPEGTRTKNGKVKTFQSAGIATLLKKAPSALIVPFVIDGNYELMEKGYYPMQFGTKLKFTALEPLDPKGEDIKELTAKIETSIKKELGHI